jgi:diguanylate cyclase (GGDEF)-like protein
MSTEAKNRVLPNELSTTNSDSISVVSIDGKIPENTNPLSPETSSHAVNQHTIPAQSAHDTHDTHDNATTKQSNPFAGSLNNPVMAQPQKNQSLVQKVVLLYFFMNIVSISLFSYIITTNQVELITDNTMYQSKELITNLLKKVQKVTTALPANESPATGTSSLAQSHSIIKASLDSLQLQYILFNDAGDVHIQSNNGIRLPDDSQKSAMKAASLKEFTGKDYYHQVFQNEKEVRFYINLQSNSHLLILIKLDEIGRRFQDLTKLILLTVGFVTILHLLFAFVLFRIVLAPILRLSAATKQVAQGQLNTHVEIQRYDEIGMLASGFNYMMDVIHKYVEDLNQKMEDLHEAKNQIELLAITDELTQMYNRRYLFDQLNVLVATAGRYGNKLGLVMLDIDHFKKVNDTFGHAAGDVVLKAVSKILRDISRVSDLPCRYGGEEMIIVLPETNLRGATLMAEKIRLEIESARIPIDENTNLDITVSIGVSEYQAIRKHLHQENLTSFIMVEAADKALYRAKENGRNQVQLFDPEEL